MEKIITCLAKNVLAPVLGVVVFAAVCVAAVLFTKLCFTPAGLCTLILLFGAMVSRRLASPVGQFFRSTRCRVRRAHPEGV